MTQLLESTVQLESLNGRLQTLQQLEASLRADVNRYPSLMAEYDRLQPAVEIERQHPGNNCYSSENSSALNWPGEDSVWEVVEPPLEGKKNWA